MRAFIYITIAFIVLSPTVQASEREAEERSDMLIGLNTLSIQMICGDLHDRLPRIELMLRRNGIALTPIDKIFNKEYEGSGGVLRFIILDSSSGDKRSSVEIFLTREAVITGATKYGRPLKRHLTVWSDKKSGLSDTTSVDIEIDKIITKFCNDYLRANPLAH